jgi:hypothetical protein
MAVKLTKRQQEVMKSMVEFAEVFADQVYDIMRNHGLSDIDGCRLDISVDPSCLFTTEVVMFGRGNKDSGNIYLTKGRRSKHERFVPTGKNSPEYERLFANETVRTAMEAGNDNEKPLPPDGLWIGDPRNDYPVGDWEWDVNDSLS